MKHIETIKGIKDFTNTPDNSNSQNPNIPNNANIPNNSRNNQNGNNPNNRGNNGASTQSNPPQAVYDPMEFLIDYNAKFKNAGCIKFRDQVIEQTMAILISKNKPNALLTGPAGSGKTKIIEDLAYRMASNHPSLPDKLQGFHIYELPLSNIVANSSYVGQTEGKLQAVLDFIKNPKERNILFIDEIHMLLNGSDSYKTIAQILKPTLARGDIRCIGATTTQEASSLEKDPAFNRRFSQILIDELTPEQTVDVLQDLIPGFMAYYNNKISIPTTILPTIVDYANDYHKPGMHRPDNAITLLDRACGEALVERKRQEILAQNDPTMLQALKSIPVVTITAKQLKTTAIKMVTGNNKPESLDFDKLKNALSVIHGQDEPIETIIKHLKRNELGLFPKTKPLTLLFAGPSGVGKTEVSKILAKAVTGLQPIILNMTEYTSEESLNRILGAAPGYIGFDSNAEMPFDNLISNPYQVIVLDEFEKCHKAVQTIFMQAFDEGYIKDNRGKTIDFSKTIIIATTNAGNRLAKKHLGFVQNDTDNKTSVNTLTNSFEPALLNRFQDRLSFNAISKETYRDILQQCYTEEVNRITQTNKRRISLLPTIPDDELDKLVEKTYNENFGARPARQTAMEFITEQVI